MQLACKKDFSLVDLSRKFYAACLYAKFFLQLACKHEFTILMVTSLLTKHGLLGRFVSNTV